MEIKSCSDYFHICNEFIKNSIRQDEMRLNESFCRIEKISINKFKIQFQSNLLKKSFKNLLKVMFNEMGFDVNIIKKYRTLEISIS